MSSCLIHSTEDMRFRSSERPLAHYPEYLLTVTTDRNTKHFSDLPLFKKAASVFAVNQWHLKTILPDFLMLTSNLPVHKIIQQNWRMPESQYVLCRLQHVHKNSVWTLALCEHCGPDARQHLTHFAVSIILLRMFPVPYWSVQQIGTDLVLY